VHYVSGAFFTTLRTPVIRGRAFTDADDEGAPRVAIVNETAARALWPGQNPIGQRLHLDVNWKPGVWAEVVGVVGDIRYGRVEDAVESDVYLPYGQGGFLATFLVRTRVPMADVLAGIRREIRAVDRDVAISNPRPLSADAESATSRTRYAALLLGVFAGIAMLLAAIGTFGVLAHQVSERRREFGVRMALGADVGAVIRLVLREGLPLVIGGVVVGLAASFAATRLLRSSLYLVSPTDPPTFLAASLVLLLVGIVAAYLPARRAALVDPVTALRSE
jgi:putative ABC transport system permease protein